MEIVRKNQFLSEDYYRSQTVRANTPHSFGELPDVQRIFTHNPLPLSALGINLSSNDASSRGAIS